MGKVNASSYFLLPEFEHRHPEEPIKYSVTEERIFQFFSIVLLVVGGYYFYWRWTASLNHNALWFAIPLALAETVAFLGGILSIITCWSLKDPEPQKPVHLLSEIADLKPGETDRPITIDVFVPTYNEDLDLVRVTIQDAKKMVYPFDDVKVNIYILDDGRRDGREPATQNFKQMAQEEQVNYITRESNFGFKGGNLNNGFNCTFGDLIVILDADTRPFPKFLIHTTGYFINRKLAWVQTPQWFYDITAPVKIKNYLKTLFGRVGYAIGSVFGKMKTGDDIFGNDPTLFYGVIQRRRNNYNAAFCCGGGSVHRRAALQKHGEKRHLGELEIQLKQNLAKLEKLNTDEISKVIRNITQQTESLPFVLHASEDIYTSIFLHSEGWQSLQHPSVECKMLSPQDLASWVKQRSRYAEGSLDIGLGKDSPIFFPGLSLGQRLSYLSTIYSYFSPLWIIVFLLSPIVYFFTLVHPITAYFFDFLKHYLPYMLLNTIVITLMNWGTSTKRSEQYFISSFWLNLQALVKVVFRVKVKFNVTEKKMKRDNNVRFFIPHLLIILFIFIGIIYDIWLIVNNIHPSLSAFVANCLWCLFNIYQLSPYIRAGFWHNISFATQTKQH